MRQPSGQFGKVFEAIVHARARLAASRNLRLCVFALFLVTTLWVAWLDWRGGPDYQLGPIYFMLLIAASLLLGAKYGIVLGFVDMVIETADERLYSSVLHIPPDPFFRSTFRTVAYVLVAYLVSKLFDVATERNSFAVRLHGALEAIEEDVRSAAALQRVLITDSTPFVPGIDCAARLSYSRALGGDFVDVSRDGDRLLFCVGDISGKGVRAALFAAFLKYIVGRAFVASRDPSKVLCVINSELLRLLPPDMFVSMVVGVVDPAAGELIYASAGHGKQLLRHGDGTIGHLNATGVLLSVYEDGYEPDNVRVPLQSDDILLFYTDGSTDIVRGSDRIGLEGLEALLSQCEGHSARQCVDTIFDSLVGGVERRVRDDITLLAIRMAGKKGGEDALRDPMDDASL